MIEELTKRIIQNTEFLNDYLALKTELILNDCLNEQFNELDNGKIKRLIESALILSKSKFKKNIAYDISTSIIKLYGQKFDVIDICYVILNRLSNIPAINLANNNVLEPSPFLPRKVFFECKEHIDTNKVSLNNTSFTLTDFQKKTWDKLNQYQSLSISAPTSSGKSLILNNYIKHKVINGESFQCVYICPSRALLKEVSTKIQTNLSKSDDIFVTTIPRLHSEFNRQIHVLTQERLNTILSETDNFKADLLVIDEAQNIADGGRGVILLDTIDQCLSRNNNTQIIFISPNISNPEYYLNLVSFVKSNISKTTDLTVSQNIIHIESNKIFRDKVDVYLKHMNAKKLIQSVDIGVELNDNHHKLSCIANHFSNNERSIIYANGQAACEVIARNLAELNAKTSPSEYLIELSNLIKTTIHKDYVLAEYVLSGIGFHYGNMPILIRNAVEEAFELGELKFIVCTSTLLQGVNLPVKNIFLLNPTKNNESTEGINPHDFWNLIGRAGRAGIEFYGNIYLIDYDTWESDPLLGDKEKTIEASLATSLKNNFDQILDYIIDTTKPSGVNDSSELAFNKLSIDVIDGRITETMNKIGFTNVNEIELIESKISEKINKLSVSYDTIKESINISMYRQDELYRYILDKINSKGPEYVMPIHPSQDCYRDYLRIIKRIHNTIEHRKRTDKSHLFFASIMLTWMRGQALPQIISKQISHKKNKNRKRATIIRETLDTIENSLRFKYVKYFNCYISVLKQALTETGNEKYIEKIPSIPLYLELGASNKTTISLMELGLSRISSSLIVNETVNKDMDIDKTKKWLLTLNMELPRAVEAELALVKNRL